MITALCMAWAAAQTPSVEAPEGPPSREQASLVVDAHVPTEVLVDGHKIAQLWYPGELRFEVVPGLRKVRLYVGGEPTDLPVTFKAGEAVTLLVGRTGISVEDPAPVELATPDPVTSVAVEFRAVGEGAQLRISGQRVLIEPGATVSVPLAPGEHHVSLRNRRGTVIWATGVLEVTSREGLVVQLSDGRLPELFGPGRFFASGG